MAALLAQNLRIELYIPGAGQQGVVRPHELSARKISVLLIVPLLPRSFPDAQRDGHVNTIEFALWSQFGP